MYTPIRFLANGTRTEGSNALLNDGNVLALDPKIIAFFRSSFFVTQNRYCVAMASLFHLPRFSGSSRCFGPKSIDSVLILVFFNPLTYFATYLVAYY